MRSCVLLLVLFMSLSHALDVGDQSPGLDGVTWIKGEAIETTGGVTIVEFWATWCPPCRKSIPHLTHLQQTYPDLRVVGLSDEDAGKVKPFVSKQGEAMAYRVGLVPKDLKAAWMVGVDGIPHAFVLSSDGVVLWAGHPQGLDGPLAAIMAGTFDPAQAKAVAKAEHDLQEMLQTEEPDLPACIHAVSELLALDPVNSQGLRIGIAIAKHQQDAAALRAYFAAIPLDRLSAEDANGLAWDRAIDEDLHFRLLDQAMRLVTHALTLEPKNAAFLDTRARIQYALGSLELAIADQTAAVAAANDDRGLAATLGFYRETLALRERFATGGAATAPAPTAVPALIP